MTACTQIVSYYFFLAVLTGQICFEDFFLLESRSAPGQVAIRHVQIPIWNVEGQSCLGFRVRAELDRGGPREPKTEEK